MYLRLLSLEPVLSAEAEREAIVEVLEAGGWSARQGPTAHPRGGFWLHVELKGAELGRLIELLEQRGLRSVV